jgi:secreted trypsin-like serine protease
VKSQLKLLYECAIISGGGLVFPDSSGQRRWVIQGIVSAGISKTGGGPGCEPKYYSVFTKVGEYLPWINREIDRFRSERK